MVPHTTATVPQSKVGVPKNRNEAARKPAAKNSAEDSIRNARDQYT